MARRTRVHQVIPWVGGINTSVDPGVLNEQELVIADNVQFSSTGARIKREALEYLDPAIPTPDYRSSSGTTKTLKWTTTPLVNVTSLNERLVAGERITVSGVANYVASDVAISTLTAIQEVCTVQAVADSSGSLNNKYFIISAGDQGTDYYVWFNVSSGGSDPAVSGKSGIEIAIATNDSASTVASAIQAVLDAHADFSASVVTDTVTVTCATAGVTTDAGAGDSGFTVTTTVKGGHSITYTGSVSNTESETAAGAIVIAKTSSVISITDYWRWDGTQNVQLLVYATDDFQLFKIESERRVQIHGQEQVSTVTCGAASGLTTGDYFLLSAANDETDYYVWYNVDSGGGDPAVSGRTGIAVAVSSSDVAADVATATASAIDAISDFSASANSTVVTITNAEAGITTAIADVNTAFSFATTTYGATAPTSAVSTIRTKVFNEDLIMVFSGLGNKPIIYNPDDNAKYQLLSTTAPDASIITEHLSRIYMNDKTDKDKIHYSPTFDHLTWGGYGDSGGFPIAPGDGDPEGITNMYPYKGFLVIAKQAKRYRLVGDAPEIQQVELISEGMGNEGNVAIPVDETDVVFVSKRGVHSQAATDAYGDTDAAYLSAKIKPTFSNWAQGRLKYMQGAYIPEINSLALSVAEEGQSAQNAIWLYNVEAETPGAGKGAWSRWPDISCQALTRRYINNQYKLVTGTNTGRIIQAQVSDDYTDFGTDGIEFKVKSGIIYVDGNAQTVKNFKKITMFYRPKGNFTFVVKAYIDDFPAQSFAFNQISGLDLLGETFILGNSILGSSAGFAPFTFTMEGVGRGLVLEVIQNTADEQIELWGFAIEYEPADIEQEVREG